MHVLILPSWYHTRSQLTRGLYFAEYAQALSESGLQVGIAYPEARSLREWSIGATVQNHWQTASAPEAGIPTVRRHGWRLIPRYPMPRARARSYLGLASTYAAQYGRPDLLHAHGALSAGVGALLSERRLGIPFCVTEHFSGYGRGQATGRERRLAAEVYRHAAGVAAVSTALCRDLQSAVAADVRPRVIPNVVDTAFYTPKPSGPQLGSFTFVTVSDLVPVKRVDLLIEAFNAAFAADTTVSLVIGGDGPCRAALESQARQQLAADPLYALRATMADILSDLRGAVASAGVAVLCPRIGGRGVGRPAYRAAVVGSMAAVADELCALGLSVRLVPLWREDDPQLCWQIAARVNCPNAVQITDVPSTAQEFGRLLGGAAVVLSMPLHGTLLSVLAGVPTVPVVYHPKCEELSKELGLSPIAIPVSPEGAIPVGLAADHAVAAGRWYTDEAEELSISTAAREREVLAAEARLVEALVGKAG